MQCEYFSGGLSFLTPNFQRHHLFLSIHFIGVHLRRVDGDEHAAQLDCPRPVPDANNPPLQIFVLSELGTNNIANININDRLAVLEQSDIGHG